MFNNISNDQGKVTKLAMEKRYMSGMNVDFSDSETKGSLSDLQEFNSELILIGNPTYHINEDILAYSIVNLIREFDPQKEGTISQTKFYKLLYLLSNDLENDGVDIKLPYYWYRYGPVVPINFLPEGILELRPIAWAKYSGKAVMLRKHEAFNLHSPLKESIDDAIGSLSEQYRDQKTSKVVLDAYATAPYEFQRKYKEFIKHISYKIKFRQIISLVQQLRENEDVVRLEDAIDSFDGSNFAEPYSELLQWRLLTKYSIQQLNSIDPSFMIDLSNIYWDKLFCRYLRIQKNKNLPQALIRKWQKDLPNLSKEYEREFKALECQFYQRVYKPTNIPSNNTRDAYCECIKSMFR